MEENIIDWWQKLSHNWKKTFLFNLDFNGLDYGTTNFFPDLYNTYYKKFGIGIRKRLEDFQPDEDNILRILNLEKLLIRHPETRNLDTLKPFKNIKSLSLYDTDIIDLKGLNCPKLESLVLGNRNLCSLEGIEDCSLLRSLRLVYCYKITNFDNVFECENIQNIDLEYLGTVEGVKLFIDSFYRQKKENALPFYKNKLSKIVNFPKNINLFEIWSFRK